MSKFCNHCGAALEDEAAFCNNCGGAVEAAPAPEAAPEAAPAKASFIDQVKGFFGKLAAAAKADPKRAGIIGGGAALIIVLIVVLCIVLGGSSPDGVVGDYLKLMQAKASKSDIKNMMPKALWEYVEEEYEVELDDVWEWYDEEYKDNWEESLEGMEEEYGKNVKISHKITDKEEMDEDDVEDLADELKEQYDIKKKSVTAAYELEVELTIKGSEDDDSNDMDMTAVKIDGKWYSAECIAMILMMARSAQ